MKKKMIILDKKLRIMKLLIFQKNPSHFRHHNLIFNFAAM